MSVPGFLDPKERIIDFVLTGVGKGLLTRGDLVFKYWAPFDDEVDYYPPVDGQRADQTEDQRRQEITETPLVREACSGYSVKNLSDDDQTNVQRPLYTAMLGSGHEAPLPKVSVSPSSASIEFSQRKTSVVYEYRDESGNVINKVGPVETGVERFGASEVLVEASYPVGSVAGEGRSGGFLVTVYASGSDQYYEEVLHNRDSSGDVVYKNDLKLVVREK